MSDRISKEQRSSIMSKIRSNDTKIERIVFSELRKRKIYFKKHYPKAPGKPDIALPRKRIAIFIDGDFWHGYNLGKLKKRLPKQYWLRKILKNVKRDKMYMKELRKSGWKILRVWEHEVYTNQQKSINTIIRFLSQ